jgi:hypothetical protein
MPREEEGEERKEMLLEKPTPPFEHPFYPFQVIKF